MCRGLDEVLIGIGGVELLSDQRMVGAPQFRGAAETTGLRMLRSGMRISKHRYTRCSAEVRS